MPRAALSERIDEAWDRRLTVLSAPAGFGKSTLLATWVTALSRLEPGCGVTALALLGSPQAPPVATVLTTVLNDLDGVAGDVAFVLDDYHVLASSSIHEVMTFIVENLPSRVHLIIATRADPPLPLSRLRARGQFLELRAHDLRFGSGHAGSYFSRMGLELSEHQVSNRSTMVAPGYIKTSAFTACSFRSWPGPLSGTHCPPSTP